MANLAATPACGLSDVRYADVVTLSGERLAPLRGMPLARIGVSACVAEMCRPIPMQIDERDPFGDWVLSDGPQPTSDSPAGVFDDNDVLSFMAADAGERRDAPATVFGANVILEVRLVDPLTADTAWVYLVAYGGEAPRSVVRYVEYDPTTDVLAGASASMAFVGGVPQSLVIDGGANVLDRLKVRAEAGLFWGWLRFRRDETDLTTELAGWQGGPIRVIRHQKQRIRLGWGIRSPTFRSYTFFYRDYAELPLGLRLNFPPTYFLSDIGIEVVLDFRDLTGWRLHVPGRAADVTVGDCEAAARLSAENRDDLSFALVGPRLALVQFFSVSPSLAPVRKRLVYRDCGEPVPPEGLPGERPGVGYALEDWGDVGAGEHGLKAVSYAVPTALDPDLFLRSRHAPLEVTVEGSGE